MRKVYKIGESNKEKFNYIWRLEDKDERDVYFGDVWCSIQQVDYRKKVKFNFSLVFIFYIK